MNQQERYLNRDSQQQQEQTAKKNKISNKNRIRLLLSFEEELLNVEV
jgi:hypothetical protein